ncbi:hypothetical protein EP1X_05285 [Thermococcus sp. EP1]|uniref:DUF998 domain-containing protein n=1 Tax=Thermococcus sp. EP1 TaxID=1591054 RepID=UPI0006D95E08|nr:DUF998 domain-containing protein [Thermococcus sp. EP1]KPU63186.1 hypothetical protein EP1X_05285 [Thermococcus sp. EP1]
MTKWLKILGLLLPIFTFGGLGIVIYLNPWFSVTENALSDMGSIYNPISYVFNSLMILVGSLGLLFGIETARRKLTTPLFLIGMLCLIFVGVFPEEYSPHSLFAVAFYLFIFADILYGGLKMIKRGMKSGFLWVLGSVTVFFVMLYLTEVFKGLAIPELLGAFFINAWIIFLALNIEK